MAKEPQGPQAVLTQACYAALGAGDIAVAFVRKLPEQLPDWIRSTREQLPDAFTKLAERGRRLTGQVAREHSEHTQDTDAAEPEGPEVAQTAAQATE